MHRVRDRLRNKLAWVGLVAFVCACGKLVGVDDLAIGECKGGVCGEEVDSGPGTSDEDVVEAGMTDVIEEPDDTPCPGTKGPPSIRVGGSGNRFCIDTTEVTVAQYREFTDAIDKAGYKAEKPVECSWKTTYAPATGGADDIPQAGIDWCDAYAYCKYAGKRLCGRIVGGKALGNIATEDLPNFNVNAWLIACSAQGQLTYPYGSIPRARACNLSDFDSGQRAVPVGSPPECIGGYPGLHDMLGNVWEWIDACRARDAGADAADGGYQKMECIAKGGSFGTAPTNMTCKTDGINATRDLRATDIGFRCCSP